MKKQINIKNVASFMFWQEKCFHPGTDLQAFIILRTNTLHHPRQAAGSGARLAEDEPARGRGAGWVARVLARGSWLQPQKWVLG